ncbi:hypothetical protein V1522DRAFT_236216 [Lipomyces starkeyi]
MHNYNVPLLASLLGINALILVLHSISANGNELGGSLANQYSRQRLLLLYMNKPSPSSQYPGSRACEPGGSICTHRAHNFHFEAAEIARQSSHDLIAHAPSSIHLVSLLLI